MEPGPRSHLPESPESSSVLVILLCGTRTCVRDKAQTELVCSPGSNGDTFHPSGRVQASPQKPCCSYGLLALDSPLSS